MKKLLSLAALYIASAATSPAFAVDVTSPSFAVSVTLTSICQVKTAPGVVGFGTYSAFQTAALAPPVSSTVVECTRGRTTAPTLAFDSANGTTSAAGATATAEGVLKGLRYTLTTGSIGTAIGTAATAGAAGTGGSGGTSTEYTYPITASMPGLQAGNDTLSASHTRTLTFTY